MSKFKNIKKSLLLGACILLSINVAQAEEEKIGDYDKADALAIQTLSTYSRSGRGWDKLSVSLGALFDSKDKEGDGIRRDERDIAQITRQADARARLINNWLRLDLNGDGSVTEQELRDLSNRPLNTQRISGVRNKLVIKPTEEQAELIYQSIKEGAKLPDLNGDGTVSIDEMLEQSRISANEKRRKTSRRGFDVDFKYDENKDGILTKEEFLSYMRGMFVKFDLNKNDKLERDERRNLRDIHVLTRTLLKKKI